MVTQESGRVMHPALSVLYYRSPENQAPFLIRKTATQCQSVSTRPTVIRKISAHGPSVKLTVTILHLGAEIKTFSLLRLKLLMFFPSRVEASHACVVSHPVDCQHVGCRPGID